MQADSQASAPSQEAINSAEKLYQDIQAIFPKAITDFEARWAALDAVSRSQATQAIFTTDEFKALERLGPKIIPLIIFKLAKGTDQDFSGVILYNRLENDPDYRVSLDEEAATLSTELLAQSRNQIIELNYQRNNLAQERIEAWDEFYQINLIQSSSEYFTQGRDQEATESADKLYQDIQAAFPKAVRDFEAKWAALEAVSHSQATQAISTTTDEFKALERLGPKIIPFIVFKLAVNTDQNSHGVFLYNRLENDAKYRVEPDEAAASDALSRCSSQIVELNYQRNMITGELIKAWDDHHASNWLKSNTGCFIQCEPYWDLLEIGTSIIASIMVAYTQRPAGFWFELLHEIIHGRQMGAHMYQKKFIFQAWSQWFEEGEQEYAPLYIQTAMDHNASFNDVLDKQNARRRNKHAFLWTADQRIPTKAVVLHRAKQQELIAQHASAVAAAKSDGRELVALTSGATDSRPAQPDSWKASSPQSPANNLMFKPDSIDQDGMTTQQEERERLSKAGPKAIVLENTRFPPLQYYFDSDDNSHQRVPSSPSLNTDIINSRRNPAAAASTVSYHGGDTPRVNGYAFVDEDEPAHPSYRDLLAGQPAGDESPNPFKLSKLLENLGKTPTSATRGVMVMVKREHSIDIDSSNANNNLWTPVRTPRRHKVK
ncbi:hypothetical protein DV738_g1134, partial [Chaetothyriales sp. CBS 135597]